LSWNPRPSRDWLQTPLSTVFFHHSPLLTVNAVRLGSLPLAPYRLYYPGKGLFPWFLLPGRLLLPPTLF
jgi:hypothetical protein